MGIFSSTNTGEWSPAKGDIVKLKEPVPDLWDELKDMERRVSVVEYTQPPHKRQPTGSLEVIILHNGNERTLYGPKGIFNFIRKG